MQKKYAYLGLATVGLVFLAFLPLRADIIQVDSGDEYNGKILDLGDEVRIELLHGGITIPKYRIVRIIPQKTIPEIYEEQLKEIKPGDAEGHYQLALWCGRNNWSSKKRQELETAITINPDHEKARRALGYRKLNGEWLTEEEYMFARGFVRYQGKWTPRELAVELIKLEQTKEINKAKEKEQKKREDLFERTSQFAVASALTAQRNYQYSNRERRGGEFAFQYNFGDGSGFSINAKAYVEPVKPTNSVVFYPPLAPLGGTATTLSTDGIIQHSQTDDTLKFLTPRRRLGVNGVTTQIISTNQPATVVETTNNPPSDSSQSQVNPDTAPSPTDKEGHRPASDSSQSQINPDTSSGDKDRGHGNEPDRVDEDNPGKSKKKDSKYSKS